MALLEMRISRDAKLVEPFFVETQAEHDRPLRNAAEGHKSLSYSTYLGIQDDLRLDRQGTPPSQQSQAQQANAKQRQ